MGFYFTWPEGDKICAFFGKASNISKLRMLCLENLAWCGILYKWSIFLHFYLGNIFLVQSLLKNFLYFNILPLCINFKFFLLLLLSKLIGALLQKKEAATFILCNPTGFELGSSYESQTLQVHVPINLHCVIEQSFTET